jgi:hypothetical protein
VVSALKDLQIGAAGQCDLDFDQNLAVTHARYRDSLNLEVFFAV